MSFLKLGSVVVLLFAWAAVCGSASPVPKDIPPASVVIVDGLWTLLGGPKPPAFVNTSFHAACSKNGFTFIRVAGTAYWPKDLALYDNNKTAYVTALEQLYQAASVNGCRILLSVFWNWFAVPDLVGEHLGDAMRNQSSVTRAWMMDYIFTVMSVASQYPEAVAGWELGNELNLLADLDMDTINPSIAPSLGTPTHRTKADNFSSADMVNFESWLAEQFVAQAVAANLPTLTSTGHSIPRSDAWHLYQSYYQPQRDWTKDTEDEFKQMLQWTSSCCDLASVHFYPGSGDRFGVKDPNSTYPLRVAFNALNGTHQTLYVGEYGNENPGPRSFSMSVLQLQSTIGIRLSTIWVWEFYQFSASSMAPFSIGTGKDDNNIRTAIQTVNTAWMAQP